jgi:hypothetical protein
LRRCFQGLNTAAADPGLVQQPVQIAARFALAI